MRMCGWTSKNTHQVLILEKVNLIQSELLVLLEALWKKASKYNFQYKTFL